jgi:hypothetical protein
MPSVKLSPLFNDAQLDNNGLPLSGGLVYWYLAGTSTPVTVYAESTGSTVNTNPVVLTTRGEPTNPIWLPTGVAYKAVLHDSLSNLIRTIDNISGVNDTATPVISEWVLYAGPATYINATQFSVTGDATATFDNGRRVKATVSGTDRYGTVNGAPVYALGVTTVTLTLDSGVLDSSLATVYYGFLDPAHPSFDTTGVNANTKAGIQSQTWTAFTTSGTSGAYTLTPNPAITAYAAGQRFSVTFHAAGSATSNTININGLGAKNIYAYDSIGTKSIANIKLNQISDIVYDGTDFVMLEQIGIVPVGTIIAYPSNTIPAGYLALPGAATNISRTTYAALFAALGTEWGAGDGSTTFGMPYCPGGMTLVNNSVSLGTVSAGSVIAHTHAFTQTQSNKGGNGPTAVSSSSENISGNWNQVTNSTGGTYNMPAGMRINYCVKY